MAKADDSIEQARRHFIGTTAASVSDDIKGLAKKYTNKYLPLIGPAIEYFQSKEQKAKQEAFNDLVLDLLTAQGKTVDQVIERIKTGETVQVVALPVERIFWGASEKKMRRFAAVVADTLVHVYDPQRTEDAVCFIRALDELSEDDIRVLKYFYNYQKDRFVKDRAMDEYEFNSRMRALLQGVASLGIQIDEFYARCGRLSGYGLVLRLEKSPEMMGDRSLLAFRMTLLGKRLVDILFKVGGETLAVSKQKT